MCLWPDEDFHQQLNRIWKSMLVYMMSRILKHPMHNCWHQYSATRHEDTSLNLNIQSRINVQPANNTTASTFRRLLLQTASAWWTITRVNYRHFSGFLLSHSYLPILDYFSSFNIKLDFTTFNVEKYFSLSLNRHLWRQQSLSHWLAEIVFDLVM